MGAAGGRLEQDGIRLKDQIFEVMIQCPTSLLPYRVAHQEWQRSLLSQTQARWALAHASSRAMSSLPSGQGG